MSLAIIALTKGGATMAGHLREKLNTCYGWQADVCVPVGYADGLENPSYPWTGRLSSIFPDIFHRYRQIICIMATGIVVRQLSGLTGSKLEDPAVVVVDEKGKFAISLLGGHWAGANRLAEKVAGVLGGQAVITTSTDVQGIKAWDVLASERNWHIANPSCLIALNSALANSKRVDFYIDSSHRETDTPVDILLAKQLGLPDTVAIRNLEEYDEAEKKRPTVVLTDRKMALDPQDLLLRPRSLYVGVGCRRGTSAEALMEAVQKVLDEAGKDRVSLAGIASIDIKKDEQGLLEAADKLGLEIKFFNKEQINGAIEGEGLQRSPLVREKIGVDGVCEPVALMAAGKGRLVVTKRTFPGVTVALAAAILPL